MMTIKQVGQSVICRKHALTSAERLSVLQGIIQQNAVILEMNARLVGEMLQDESFVVGTSDASVSTSMPSTEQSI